MVGVWFVGEVGVVVYCYYAVAVVVEVGESLFGEVLV